MSSGICAQSTELATEASVRAAMSAVDSAASESWSDRSVFERIVGQNAALRLAICSGFREHQVAVGERVPVLRRKAIRLVQQLALSRKELVAMGSVPSPEISHWLGDPAAWLDLRPPGAVALHEQGYGFTKAIRTMLIGATLVNLGQLVAVDAEWQPHITPIVGSLEVRRPLESTQATLCAASLDVDWFRCGAPAGLRPFGEGKASVDPGATVVFRTDRIIAPCRSCHTHLGFLKGVSLPPGKEQVFLATRRQVFLKEVAAQIEAAQRP